MYELCNCLLRKTLYRVNHAFTSSHKSLQFNKQLHVKNASRQFCYNSLNPTKVTAFRRAQNVCNIF